MRRSLSTLALTLPLVTAAATPAAAEDVTVPGCFGVVVVVCDPTVTVTAPVTVGTTEFTVPVCAGICYDVPVTLVTAGPVGEASVCLSYENRAGAEIYRYCVTRAVPTVPDYVGIVTEFVEDFIDGRSLNEIADDTTEDVADEMWDVLCRVPLLEDNVQCW